MTEYYDNTRLSSTRSCPRKYYFRHYRHWTGLSTALPLIFGLSWHEAMDVVWIELDKNRKLKTEDLTEMAMKAFMDKWIEEGQPSMQELIDLDPNELKSKFKFRTPMVAMEMLWEYIDHRRDFITECGLVDVERPFAVPLNPDDPSIVYVGRLDKVIEDRRKRTKIVEHKTTSLYSVSEGLQPNYIEGFSPNSQVDGYLHAGRVLYGKKLRECLIDAALVHKNHHDIFKFIPVNRGVADLDAWLWETYYWIQSIRDNREAVENFRKTQANTSYLPAFPKDTSSCLEFNSLCPYLDLCKTIANPESLVEIPQGYKEEKWEPFDVLGLETLGLEREVVA